MKGDLHIHTNISDGSLAIEEILIRAKKNGVTHLSITNHDTVKGSDYAVDRGKEFNIHVIPGIEISAYDFKSKRKVHILGYKFSSKGENIEALCSDTLKARNSASLWQIDRIREAGYKIDLLKILEKTDEGGEIYNQHIMEELVSEGYTDEIYSDLYRKLFKGKGIASKEITYVDAGLAIEVIKNDGGVAVLAHPGQQGLYDLIPKLVEKGLDGIELNHEAHSLEDYKRILDINKVYDLILTGGTDFHGRYGTNIDIGEITCPEKSLLKLFD